MYINIQLSALLPLVVGTTKKEIASRLDASNPLFQYNVEVGLTSYNHYTRNELLETCIRFGVDPISEYEKMGRTIKWQRDYADVTGTVFMNYNSNHHQG